MSDERWVAVQQRDIRRDFVFAVRTTGVFCWPSCAARQPKRVNVEFYDTATQAIAAGYRPCRRCRPTGDDPHRATVERLRHALDANPALTLAELGRLVALSPSRVQRIFRAGTGLTPREYARAQRQQRVHDKLRHSESVTAAAFDAGYGSLRAFYDQTAFGMPPTAIKQNGKGRAVRYTVFPTPLGRALLAATNTGVCAARFGDSDDALIAALRNDYADAEIVRADDELRPLADTFAACLDDDDRRAMVRLDITATAFQQRVWDALRRIPRGETRSYAQIAAMIDAPRASRAVGTACGANPVAVLIPCHRGIGSDGTLHGYRWGIERKQALLEREQKLPTG